MSDLNKVMLIGRLGQDPECKAMPSGERVANFSLATGDKWKDKETGEAREKTEWHRVVAYGKVVDVIEKYTKKGGQIFVEGQLRTRKWTDKNGQERYTTEIVLKDLQLLGSAGGSGGRESPPPGDPPRTGGQAARPRPAPAVAAAGTGPGSDELDDDIPF